MKNLFINVFLLVICIFSFAFIIPNKSDSSDEYLLCVTDTQLMAEIAHSHPALFDEVVSLQAHKLNEEKYILKIQGFKNNEMSIQNIAISKNEFETNLQNLEFVKSKNDEFTTYCYRPLFPDIVTCADDCLPYPSPGFLCDNMELCGIGSECIPL